ncbi:class I SAM-dependent DNA methyltransferase [Roseibium hamelinense]|nr:methyltransferase domain-containing protein [Roseibium hamelinense]
MSDKAQRLLENAYALETPDDSRAYYRGFAASYDEDFADVLGFVYPQKIAEIYRQISGPDDGPIADIGCGTGLVAQALDQSVQPIDGMDISPDMLARANEKALYRRTFEIDLTGDLGPICNDYGALLSSGTFTQGHLGPEVLEKLLGIARPGALFVIGVNKVHFTSLGFEAMLQALMHAGRISGLEAREVRIYAKDGHEHSEDMALAVSFRKA